MPVISVIVPVYNVDRYLSQCIDSILNQTLRDIEVICINDGSPDRSGEILDAYARLDDRVRVIAIKNQGVSHARNVGIDAARGTYLCFVDSDDLLMPRTLNIVVKAFEKNDVDVIKYSAKAFPASHSTYWINSTLSVGEGIYRGYSSRLIFDEHTRPFPWNGAYRTSFIKQNDIRFPENLSLGEDQVFSFATLGRSRATQLIPDQLYYYRLSREDSLTALASGDKMRRLSTHQRVVNAILDDWRTQGHMEGESASRILDFICIFLLFDIFEFRDLRGRDTLLSSLSGLLHAQMGRDELCRWASSEGVRRWLLSVYDYEDDPGAFGQGAVYGLTRAIYGRKAALLRRMRDIRNVFPSVSHPHNDIRLEIDADDDGEDVDAVLSRLHCMMTKQS